MAHARRKFFDLHVANESPMAAEALRQIQLLYEVEADAKGMDISDRQAIRLARSVPLLESLHKFLRENRAKTADNGASAKAIDYSLKRWDALSRYAMTGDLPIDNNPVEQTIRPVAIGKNYERPGIMQSSFVTPRWAGGGTHRGFHNFRGFQETSTSDQRA